MSILCCSGVDHREFSQLARLPLIMSAGQPLVGARCPARNAIVGVDLCSGGVGRVGCFSIVSRLI